MLPQDIYNRALDAIGAGTVIGDFTDGTRESEIGRRLYGATLRQLLAAAHWSFARKMAPLLLLGDASGQTLDPGTGVAISTAVEPPWTYCYAWPGDGVKARWLPWQQQQQTASVPLMTALASPPYQTPLVPARFLVSSSDQFPAAIGQADWDNLPDFVEGQGLIGRRVILTDVPNAQLVYTKLALTIEEYDPVFTEALVALLGARAALPVLVDPGADAKERLAMRQVAMRAQQQQTAIAKDAVMQARVVNANDSGFPQTIDHIPDWIRARRGGINPWATAYAGAMPGYLSLGWDSLALADGSVF